MFTAIVFFLILSLLVLIHEFGHFITAKKFGIKVEEFGFGFPPRVFGKKFGETLYSFNLLPIGGFVKLYGEDDAGGGKIGKGKNKGFEEKKDIKRAFFARPAWQRAIVVVAGVVMNLLLAIVIYYVFLIISNFKTFLPLYPSVSDPKFYGVVQENKPAGLVIEEVSKNSPAANADISVPSRVVSVDGTRIESSDQFVELVNESKGEETTIALQNLETDQNYTVSLTPRENPPQGEGSLGVGFNYYPVPIAFLEYKTPAQKVFSGITHPVNLAKYNFQIFGNLFSQSVEQKTAAPLGEGVSGPVGIFAVVGQILQIPDAKEAILQILNIAGLLSISLAIFNILPIPALDGGRLFFILVEMFTGKKVSPRFEGMAHAIGMALLLALILLVTVRDITRFF